MKSSRAPVNNTTNRTGPTRSYSAALGSTQNRNNNPNPPPPPAPGLTNTNSSSRSSPALQDDPAMNQIHAFVRGLSKTDKDVHRSAFLHLIQSMIGKDVQLDLKDGTILTGVLHTTTFPLRKQSPDSEFPMFTQDFPKQILLKACKVKQMGSSGKTFEAGATIVIDYSDVIATTALNLADLHHRAVSADFRTDASIKKQDLSYLQGRELQGVSNAWLDPTTATSLQSGGKKEWDQFETNRLLFDVKSTYDENLYTKKLDKSAFTPEQIARAERLAREIEGQQNTQNIHLLEERGLLDQGEIDEEAMYSGVIRQDYQPAAATATTTVNRSGGPSPRTNNGKANPNPNTRLAPSDQGPWRRGLGSTSTENKRASASTSGKELSPPPALTPTAPVTTTTEASDSKDRVSPVRFGNFNETISTPTTGIEAGVTKVSISEEANLMTGPPPGVVTKPLPGLTPTPGLSAKSSTNSLQEMGGMKTPTKEGGDTDDKAANAAAAAAKKLNPFASEWKPNVNAPSFTPSFASSSVTATTTPSTIPAVVAPSPSTLAATTNTSFMATAATTTSTPTTVAYTSPQPPPLTAYSGGGSTMGGGASGNTFESPATQRYHTSNNTSIKNSPNVGPMAAVSPSTAQLQPGMTPVMNAGGMSPAMTMHQGPPNNAQAMMAAAYQQQYAQGYPQGPGYDPVAYAQAVYYQQAMLQQYYQQQQQQFQQQQYLALAQQQQQQQQQLYAQQNPQAMNYSNAESYTFPQGSRSHFIVDSHGVEHLKFQTNNASAGYPSHHQRGPNPNYNTPGGSKPRNNRNSSNNNTGTRRSYNATSGENPNPSMNSSNHSNNTTTSMDGEGDTNHDSADTN